MAPPSSSKKDSDKDPIKRKKTKSKSKSAKSRRRRDSSVSSYSSSDSERDSRRKRSITRSRKIEKRRKDRKGKSKKKKSRRESSVSYGSRTCSTCSGSGRSVSPVLQGRRMSKKLGRKEGERGRRSSRHDRYRSRSCSTCSGSRSRSPIKGSVGRTRSPSPVKGGVGRTRSRSPIEERYCRKGSPFEERYSGKSSPIVERYRGKSSPVEERYSGNGSPFEERYSGNGSPIEERYSGQDEKKRLRSVIEVRKSFDEDRDKDGTVKDYDDRRKKKRHTEHGDKENDLYDNQGEDKRRAVRDFFVGNGVSLVCGLKESEVVGDGSGKEAADLEMILRQKALENFRKFRGRVAGDKGTIGDKKDETCKVESSQGLQSFVKASESEHTSSMEDQMHVKEAVQLSELKATSVQSVPIDENKGNIVQSISNKSGSSKPIVSSNNSQKNNVKRAEVSSNNLSSEETSLVKDVSKKFVAQIGGDKASEAEDEETDRLASRTLKTDNQNLKPNEPTVEFASRSQFEQKTFSRMHDGEVVQVSYKVYIPKKTPPALARRQLQR